jgi:hypothetical protein
MCLIFCNYDNAIYCKKCIVDNAIICNEKFTFEIGGKNKTYRQIKDLTNSFIAADDIEYGYKNKIPLWLFGFLY